MLHRRVNGRCRRCPVSFRHGRPRRVRRRRRDDDPPEPPSGRGRGRRIVTVAIVGALVVSMVFLAFISGRGVVTDPPDTAPRRPRPPRAAGLSAAGGRRHRRAAGHDGRDGRRGDRGRPARHRSSASRPGRPTARGSRSSARPPATTGIYVFPATDERRRAGRPGRHLPQRRPPAVLPVLVARWPAGELPDDRADRISPCASRPPTRARPATAVRTGSPLYWAWAGPDRLLVHSGVEGADGFFGAIGLDGTAPEPERRRAGQLPGARGQRRRPIPGYTSPADARAGGRGVDRRHDPPCHRVFGTAALDFGPIGDELAFIAASAAGPAVGLPIGPLRLIDAASGAVRTLLRGLGRRRSSGRPTGRRSRRSSSCHPADDKVAATAASSWRGRRAPGGRTGTRRRAAAAARLPLRLVFVTVGSGVDPLAADRPRVRRLRPAGAPVLRPVRAEPSPLVARRRVDRPAGVSRRTAPSI